MNKKESLKDVQKNQRIQVFARCRPINSIERKQFSPCIVEVTTERKEMKIYDKDKHLNKVFVFDKVFGPETKQVNVYKAVVGPLIQEVLMGYNCTVFAYGQTGTGKTFTMEGERSNVSCSWEEDPSAGIIPRSLHQLFEELNKGENVEFSVHVSFLELYNEELFDLLSTNDLTKLRLFEDSARKGSVVIQGLEELVVNTKDEVYAILEKGTARRQTAATLLNATSSRSHTVFSVTVHIKENTIEGEELLKTGKLNLVDLAGSENIGRSGAQTGRAREAGNINQSLLTLGRVITSLVEKAPHVPYRESKLTRLLQDSLGGHTKTSIIATVSPALCNSEETISTLDYAQRAKNITIKPEINQKMTKKTLIKEYTEEIERLRKDLVALRDKNGFHIDWDNYNAILKEITDKADEIKEMSTKIEGMTEQMLKLEDLFSVTENKLSETTVQLDNTCKKYNETSKKLSSTSRELKCTQKVLSETALQRDENRYIIDIQNKTEKILSQQAHTLLQVADESTNDVSALHEKIDRKQCVETTNQQRSQEFRCFFQKELAKLDDMMTCMTKEESGHLKALQTHVGTTLNLWDVQKSSALSLLSNLVTFHNQHMDAVADRLKISTDEHTRWSENTVQNVSQRRTDQKTKLDDFVEEKFVASIKALECIMSNQEDLLHEIQTQLSSKIKQQETAVLSHVSAQKQLIDHMWQKFKTFSTNQASKLDVCEQKALEIVTKQANFKHGMADKLKLLSETLISLGALAEKHNEEINEDVSKLQNDVILAAKGNTAAVTEIKGKIDDLMSSEEALEQITVCALNDLSESHNEGFNKLYTVTQSLAQNRNKINEDILSFLKESELAQQENVKFLENDLQNYQKTVVEKCQDNHSYIEDVKASLFKLADDNESLIAEQDAQFKVQVHVQKASLSEAQKRLLSWTGSLKKELLQRDLDVDKFLSDDLTKDIPTGTTPERKNYSFPRTLAATSPLDKVLHRFRSQLAENTAIALDLPLNSSFDESAESSQTGSTPTDASTESIENVADNSYSSDDSNAYETDSSISSLSDAGFKSSKNKENKPCPLKASKLPRTRLPKKIFAKPNALAPQRKPLFSTNEDASGK